MCGSRFRPARWFAGATLLALGFIVSLSVAEAFPEAKEARAEALALDQQIIDAAKKDSEIMANLTYLSDIIGPRLTGSAALKKASNWTAEKMKGYGLSNVELEAWSIPAGWERGPATARIIEPDNGRALTIAALGWTPGTKGKIEGEVVIITAKNSKELAAYKGKLKNAVVLHGKPVDVLPIGEVNKPTRAPDQRPGDATKTGGEKPSEKPPTRDSASYRQMAEFRRELTEFLRVEGVAVLLMDAGKPHGLMTTTGGWRGPDRASASEPLPSAFVAHEHYALLYRLATRPAPAKTRIEIDISNKLIPGPIAVYNTVGELRGSDKPDEFVILGAHLDSWDLAQGTTDNGTGTCVVLEAARMLAKSGVKPKRTIRFILFTGEEQGLYGSKAYVQKHKDELPRISMCLVHDTGTGKVVGMGMQGRAAVKPVLESELESLKEIGFKEINLRSLGGSDHMSFDQAGVPGFAVQQDLSDYRLTHHSQSDTLDKAKEADLVQGAQVLAVTALRVANMPALLPREKKVEKKGAD